MQKGDMRSEAQDGKDLHQKLFPSNLEICYIVAGIIAVHKPHAFGDQIMRDSAAMGAQKRGIEIRQGTFYLAVSYRQIKKHLLCAFCVSAVKILFWTRVK
jgi:hypothetical protein